MRLLNLIIAACILIFLLGGISILALRILLPDWWKRKSIRLSVMLLPLLTALSVAIWAYGFGSGSSVLNRTGAISAPAFFVVEVALVVSFILAGIINTINRLGDSINRLWRKSDSGFSRGRRRVIKTVAAIVPVAALGSSITGVAESYGSVGVPVRRIPVAGLPPGFQGFKIAHLSDMHLGYYVHLDDLEDAIERVKAYEPELVLVTGDISDDLKILPDALRIIDSLSPPYGIYASVGNHEYYRGITEVLRIFRGGPFPILLNSHVNINVENKNVFLGGADDPRVLRKDNSAFLRRTIERTMGGASADSFRLLMCHRPEGFDHSAEIGLDLVLSGHTHGGQIGFGGRSLFEPIFPEKYLWGIYQRRQTTMHTSGGMGHWFPFRLGVPAEAPILVLEEAHQQLGG